MAHHAFGQGQLQQRQAAGFQQRRVIRHLGHQAFLGRHGNHMRRRQAQNLGRGGALPVNLRFDLLGRAQRVPQRVDLVEHHQPGVARGVFSDQVFTPDGQIRLGHAGISRQNEHHRMRLRNQADGQLRLGPDGVQPRRVQNHQPLLEQRVRNVDQRVPPLGHFHQTIGAGARIVLRAVVVPETQRTGIVHTDISHFGHLLQRLGQLSRVVDVQVHPGPLFGRGAPLHQGLGFQARFNGQQAQAGRHVGVPAQLGRAHGGAPSAGRHDAAAIARKKDGVDQLRLAA